MINSRKVDDLLLPAKKRALDLIHEVKWQLSVDLLVTNTYRDDESQAALYAQGRTTAGFIVTNARPGDSLHQYRIAFDVVPLRNGKPVWGTAGADGELWQKIGAIGESLGLEWAGRWKRFKEYPHFQFTGGLTLADFKAGKLPEKTA